MDPKAVWLKPNDEMPAVEVCTKEQLRLLGRHREEGIAHYKAKYEGLQ